MLYLRDIEVDVHVRCRACGHEGVLPRADMNRRFGPNYPVLSIAPHYRCSRCNSRDTESRPAPPPFSTPVMASAEDTPSFAAPLAALQGLLDAMRGRGDTMDGPEEDVAPVPAAPVPATARPVAAPDPDLDLELERLAADSGDAPESGRRPLWEPVSLADLAGHHEDGHHDDDDGTADEAAWDDDEDWSARRWTLADRDADESRNEGGGDEDYRIEPAPPAPRVSPPAAADDPDDDASRSFDRTIAALRSILDGRGDGARAEEPPAPPLPPPAPATPPVFSLKDAVDSRDDEPDELDGDGPDGDEFDGDKFDGDDGAEPSNDDILGFAIRDPDKAPPPWERVRERDPTSAGGEPLDRTIAALRSMVQKAAADRDEDEDEDGDDRDDGVVTPLFGRSRKPADGLDSDADDDGPEDDGPEDDEAEDRHAGADDAFWNRAGTDEEPDDAPDKDGAPAPRKSAQEQDMEEALRALRALVEAENDLDEPPTPAWKSEALPRPEANALPGFKPLPRPAPQAASEDDEDDEPLDLVPPAPAVELEKAKPEKPASEKPAPEKPRPGTGKRGGESSESGKKAAKDDSGTLGKTLAALRNMLELDGKQGR
ncbi:hypothetical protein FBZ82_103533 [Azospirillum brasilense]|uniref:Uncharacterized protein n=2 Tax=Azospirillum brasilense TaxID=192 RepID=A0A560BFZ6_AZOBR|nr:hypothetical protein FBZ82_103533 [Azospirillum brasilense]